MKIRLHEIELGSGDVEKATGYFMSLLGLKPSLQQEGLTVFEAGVQGLDFNLSNHLPKGEICLSFLTDDLAEAEQTLKAAGIPYKGPSPSHLGMIAIQFKNPDGYTIKVNTPGASSSDWLKA